ncbi:MAG: VWA domain-containing protein [Myxococcales bacterium]|nr:VWA domain-containing protein [Myxococcales bacterium]
MTSLRHAMVAIFLLAWPSGCVVNPVPTPGTMRAGGAAKTATEDNDFQAKAEAAKADATTASDSAGAAVPAGMDTSSADAVAAADASGGGDSALTNPDAPPEPGATGLSQAGAQDFGLFRKILEAGGIPAPKVLDDLGFFAEHKLDYPAPKCGQDMCMHPLLGIMGNMITGSTCTVLQVGLNTPITVDKLARPPLDLVVAIDTSSSMAGAPLAYVQQGLQQMLDHLQKDDLVSIVAFADSAQTVVDAKGLAKKMDIEKAILQMQAGGQTNLFAGLFHAFQLAAKAKKPGRQTRVLFLSDGAATAGLLQPAKLVSLAVGYAKMGIGITTVGVGMAFEVQVLKDLAEVGAGNFYFLDKPAGVKEVFAEEVETFMVPVALDVGIDVKVAPGYVLRGVYGTHGWKGGSGGGKISIPTLFLAGRTKAEDPLPGMGEGRRGGGGAILIELIALPGVVAGGKAVGSLALTWTHPLTGKVVTQTAEVDGPIKPGEPVLDGGYFSHPTVEKGFVMLNLFAAFTMAAALAHDADPGAAQGVLLALQDEVQKWLKKTTKPDPDIVDDLKYVDLFVLNLKKAANQTPISKPPEPWPKD